MTLVRPRFEAKFDFGSLLQLVGFAVMLGGYVWVQSGWQSTVNAALERDARDIQILKDQASARVALYAPRIDAMEKANGIQDERISNIIEGNQRRDGKMDKQTELLTQISIDLATIRARNAPAKP